MVQPDGKFIAVGSATPATGPSRITLARYTPSGALDLTFGSGGWVTTTIAGATSQAAQSSALDANGNILVGGQAAFAGSVSDFLLARYISSGVLDSTFGGGTGYVTTDLGTVCTGDPAQLSFDTALGITVQADGKVPITGTTTPHGSTASDLALARYNPDGTLDTTFGTDGVVDQAFYNERALGYAVGVQSTGQLVVFGPLVGTAAGSLFDFGIIRFNSNGALDTTFGTNGQTAIDYAGPGNDIPGVGLASLADDSILVSGSASHTANSTSTSTNDIALVKLQPNGALDPTFGVGSPWGPR